MSDSPEKQRDIVRIVPVSRMDFRGGTLRSFRASREDILVELIRIGEIPEKVLYQYLTDEFKVPLAEFFRFTAVYSDASVQRMERGQLVAPEASYLLLSGRYEGRAVGKLPTGDQIEPNDPIHLFETRVSRATHNGDMKLALGRFRRMNTAIQPIETIATSWRHK